MRNRPALRYAGPGKVNKRERETQGGSLRPTQRLDSETSLGAEREWAASLLLPFGRVYTVFLFVGYCVVLSLCGLMIGCVAVRFLFVFCE